jgi:hypothetical protein
MLRIQEKSQAPHQNTKEPIGIRRNKWQSQIRIDGHSIHLGYFSTDYEAHLAYCKAAAVLHGDFANFG